MNALRLRRIAAAIAVACTWSAGAHHSFAPYDRTKQVTLTGVVREFQWTNPHAWIQIVVTDAQGREVEWGAECGSPNMMARTGWKRATLAPGDRVTVIVNPLLDGKPNGSLVKLTLADGTVLGPGDAPPPRPLGSTQR
jgi:Family of unknown function (DUF6152)